MGRNKGQGLDGHFLICQDRAEGPELISALARGLAETVGHHRWLCRRRALLHHPADTNNDVRLNPRQRLSTALLLCCLLVATGQSQYVEDSIDVGGAWVGSLAYNSRADVLYGGCQTAGILFAISCDSNKVVRSLALDWPRYLTYDSVDNKGYVAFKGAGEDSLAVVDGSTHQVVKKIEMPGATMPVWDPASDRVYVSCQSTNKVAVVDCATDSLLTYIAVGTCPMKMYINTLRRKLYVLNYDDGTVSIVDMTTNQVIKTVDVGGTPNAGYYCRAVDKFYSDGQVGQCVVIGGQSDTIVARIAVPGTEYVLSATGNEQAGIVFAGMFAGNAGYIVAIDAFADSITYTHNLGHALAEALLYSTESEYVYGIGYLNGVSVLAGDGSRVIKTIPLGDSPFAIAAAPMHQRLYVGDLNTSFVYVLRDMAGIAEPQSLRRELCGVLSAAPNPFRGAVRVQVRRLPSSAHIPTEVEVFATNGRVVGKLRLSPSADGASCAVWDGRDLAQVPAPAGVYLVTTNSGDCLKVVKAE